MDILKFLEERNHQLGSRITSIEAYAGKPYPFAGTKRDFSLDDIPGIKEKMEETEVAIKAIKLFRKNKKK